jgi:hypothetical protein
MTHANEATRRNSQSRRSADQAVKVYDEQHCVGSVVERDGKALTYDIDGLRVGVFATLRPAVRALKTSSGEA